MFVKFTFLCFLCLPVARAIHFSITPDTFVPGVTSDVVMRCDVADSGSDLSQLLLLQLEVMEHGTEVPLVTLTPGQEPRITGGDLASQITVDGQENQFTDIAASYLQVTFSFPPAEVAGNYSCVVSGLSSVGLLARYSSSAVLTVGAAVDQLPRFMMEQVVELRQHIENLKQQKASLLEQARLMQEQDRNISRDLASLEQEYSSLENQLTLLKSSAATTSSILDNAQAPLDRLSNVRPPMKIAFHSVMPEMGARTVELNTPLIFDHVITNEGLGYNPLTGVFRAPVTGTYLLALSLESGAGNRPAEVSMKVGNRILQTIQIADDTDYEESSASTIVKLLAGQEVTCEYTWQTGNPGYVGSTFALAPYVSTFSGYIIW